MNTYRYRFVATCPNNGEAIVYTLSIATSATIFVEHIKVACAMHKAGYHENIAAALHDRFGGVLTLVANHHGVDIETVLQQVKQ